MNAAKHGKAARLTVAVEETAHVLAAAFTDDGQGAKGPIEETGGLHNLRLRIERAGGKMETDAAEGFCLSVMIPKQGGFGDAVSRIDR